MKRLLDFIVALFGLVLVSPIMLMICIWIRVDSKGPIFFKQQRLGKNKKLFTIYKFRTMIDGAYYMEGGATSFEGDRRITKAGKILRKTSLDELPQLVNILKGNMSFVGPRPILSEEFLPYEENEHFGKRYCILPGLFCSVDIELRASASREEQFELDAEYVDSITLIKDVEIMFLVFKSVLKRKNIYKQG